MIVRIESARHGYIYGSSAPKVTYERNVQFEHHGVKGQKWGVRRYQNYDGTWKNAKYKKAWEDNEKYKSMAKSKRKADVNKANEFYKQNKRSVKLGEKMERRSIKQNKIADFGDKNIKENKTVGKSLGKAALAEAAAYGLSLLSTGSLVGSFYSPRSGKARTKLRGAAFAGLAATGAALVASRIYLREAIGRWYSRRMAKDRAQYEMAHQQKSSKSKK